MKTWMAGLLALVGSAVAAVPAQADWNRAESDHFIVYGRGDPDKLAAFTADFERFDKILRVYTGLSDEAQGQPVEIYLANSGSELRRASDMNNAAGFYLATAGGVCGFATRKGNEWESLVRFHEYSHHFMLQHFPVAYPAWFVEGFAEYFGTAKVEERTARVGYFNKGRVSSLFIDKWLDLDELLEPRAHTLSANGYNFYAQSWLLTHYMYADEQRRQQLGDYLDRVAKGEPSAKAFEAATGSDLLSYQRAVERYAKKEKLSARVLEFQENLYDPSRVRVTALPQGSDDVLLPAALIRCGNRDDGDSLARIRKEAERDPDDDYIQRAWLFSEAQAGDTATAIEKLPALLEANPKDPAILYHIGRAYSRRAHEDGFDQDENHQLARGYYARANAVRPDHFPTLYYYATDGDLDDENDRSVLWRAGQLAPQVEEIRVQLAFSLLLNEEWEAAEAALAPVAFSAHSGRDEMRKLLERIRARDQTLREVDAEETAEKVAEEDE